MQQSKPAVQSSACIGSCAVITFSVVGIIVAKTNLPAEYITPVITPLVGTLIGGVLALFGRIKASTKISGLFS